MKNQRMAPATLLTREFKRIANDAVDRFFRRPPVIYTRFRKLLQDQDSWSDEARQRWIHNRTQRTLVRAARLPGYRHIAANEISRWPTLEKSRLLGHESDFINPSTLPYHAAATGGTTGHPLAIRRSLAAVAFEQASIDHLCAQLGLELATARVAVLRADHVKALADKTPPFWRTVGPRKLLLSSFHLMPDTIRAYADAIQAYKPDLLMCYPSALSHLIALLAANRIELHIPFILASSESMSAQLAIDAQKLLGATVIDYYGQAERVAASFGINGAPHRLLPLYGYVELGDELEGGRELIGTSLWNDAQILVRYRTGDVVRVNHGTQSSGPLETTASFTIEGRGTEHIVLPDGRVIVGINHLPRGVPGIVSLQLRQTGPRQIELFAVPAADYGPASEEAILTNCALKFPDDVTLKIIKIEAPIRIASGKAPLLLR